MALLFITSALDRGGWLTPRSGRFLPRKGFSFHFSYTDLLIECTYPARRIKTRILKSKKMVLICFLLYLFCNRGRKCTNDITITCIYQFVRVFACVHECVRVFHIQYFEGADGFLETFYECCVFAGYPSSVPSGLLQSRIKIWRDERIYETGSSLTSGARNYAWCYKLEKCSHVSR